MNRRKVSLGLGFGALGAAVAAWLWPKARLSEADFAALYTTPLAPPAGPVPTYHLGHSLVGRDMPAMLAQLAGHRYASQLGWGASLKNHAMAEVPGFAEENAHSAHLGAQEALQSGAFKAVVLTEMVEIRDAIRYHDSARYLAHWARLARAKSPDARVYLYETWHRLDDPEGWLTRLDADLPRYWEAELLRPAMAEDGCGTIYVIPAGQVMAAAVRAIEAGAVAGLATRDDLFTKAPDGTTDQIHLGDIGAYLVALVHYATLYHQSPEGLPHALKRADGTNATPPDPQAALALQKVVWQVVTGYQGTGVRQHST